MSSQRAAVGAQQAPGAAADGFVPIARLEELHGDGPFALSGAGVDVVVVRTSAGLKAYEGRCPHQGALLGEGELQGGTLVCRNHGWRFDAATGARAGGPQCLRACPLRVDGPTLLADVSALPTAGPARATRRLKDLPGPRGLPLLGVLPQLPLDRLHQVFEGWVTTYGPLFRFRLGPRTCVAVADPDLIEQVLRARPEGFTRFGAIEPVFAELGIRGVFSAEGAAWRPQRRLAMEALSQRHLRGFYPTLRAVAVRLRRRLASHPLGSAIDIAQDFRRFTVDVTTQLALGYDVNTLEREDDPIHGRLDQLFPTLNRRLFATIPYWRVLRLPRDRRVDRALAELRAWLSELLAQARARLAADPARAPANFLEAMVHATDESGHPFSDDDIYGNAIEILVAGEDTTANTLAWAVHHLCDHPEVADRLRAEADAILGDDVAPADLDAVRRLAYAAAVAGETMRLRPVAPIVINQAIRPTVLGDVAIPAGTDVFLVLRAPARDAANFAAPADFRPERWLGAVAGAHEPRAHMPFGSGPRICPGRSLALVEMNLVLAVLYHAFEIRRAPGGPGVREAFSFTMSPVGLRVNVHERTAPFVPAAVTPGRLAR